MQSAPCPCLLCTVPGEEGFWGQRERLVAATVREHGWHIVGVEATEHAPTWCYSIGLWHTVGSPELSVFGVPPEEGMGLLFAAGAAVRDAALRGPHHPSPDLLAQVTITPVHPSWYLSFFGAGVEFYRWAPPPFLQLRLPHGSPWPGGEPQLWLSRDEQPAGLWVDLDPTWHEPLT